MAMFVVMAHIIAVIHWPQRFHGFDSPLFFAVGFMDVFFCISGFLITRNLIKTSARDKHWVRHYLYKRALRIWPAYYVALVVAIAVSLLLAMPEAPKGMRWNGDLAYLLKTVLFLQNTEVYFGAKAQGAGAIPTFSHSWSVAIEEQFYLAVVLLMVLRVRWGLLSGWRLLALVLLLLPLGQVVRYLLPAGWTLLGRMDGFLFGITLALLEPGLVAWRKRNEGWFKAHPGRLGTALIVVAFIVVLPFLLTRAHGQYSPLWRYGLFEPLFAFSCAGFLVLAGILLDPVATPFALLRLQWAQRLGQMSYSLYLFHLPMIYIAEAARRAWGLTDLWLIPASVLLSLLAGHLGFQYVEMPFMRLKKKVDPIATASAPPPLPESEQKPTVNAVESSGAS